MLVERKLGVVTHNFNPSIQEAQTGKLLRLGQPYLHRNPVSGKTNPNKMLGERTERLLSRQEH